ncbi:MAG TPA: ATP-binding protein [Pirellulales bacterium]|jgi:signal transduction histidine kinase|nr:ATP-binding protein [Pirellulales bacterium]
MNLRGKLLLAQIPVGLALVLVGLVAVASVSMLGASSQNILSENYRSVLAAQRMKESLERVDSAALFFASDRRQLALEQATLHRKRFEAELEVEEGNITEPGERDAARRVRTLWDDYRKKLDRFFAQTQSAALVDTYFRELQPEFVKIKDAADQVLVLNQDAMVHKSDLAEKLARRAAATMALTALAAIAFGILFSAGMTNRLVRPLSVLSQAVGRLEEGDFRVHARIKGDDEIARLAQRFNNMAEHLDEYRNSSLGELLLAQQSAQAAIESFPDPTIIYTLEGSVLNMNRPAEELLAKAAEIGSADPGGLVDARLKSVLDSVRNHVLQGKGPYVPRGLEEALRVALADEARFYLPRATPIYDQGGAINGATVILQDVTRLRRFDELKNDLVATVAHEFRTPLTSLRMAIYLCTEGTAGPLTAKQGDLLFAAREDCERLQNVVDELLNLARIQSGHIEIHARPIAASSLIETALSAHRGQAEQKQLRIKGEPLPIADEAVADPERIELVFSNLIGNAIRYTPEGGLIQLRARRVDGQVRFDVVDSGQGIPQEYQHAIFEKFFRVPGSQPGGAGLGLFIAKEIVEAHGGKMGLQSQPGQGCDVWFTLPLASQNGAGGRAG